MAIITHLINTGNQSLSGSLSATQVLADNLVYSTGNTTSVPLSVGTLSNQSLALVAGGATRVSVTSGGAVNINNGSLAVSTPNTITQTWNNASAFFSCNVTDITITNAAGGNLHEWRVNGASKVSIDRFGNVLADTLTLGSWILGRVNGLFMKSDLSLAWTNGTASQTPDTILRRDSAGVIAQRNSTNPQEFRTYGSFTDSTNFERLALKYNSSNTAFEIGTEAGSAGGGVRRLDFATGGTTKVTITSAGNVGIGTSNPTYLLDVNGAQNVSGDFTLLGNVVGSTHLQNVGVNDSPSLSGLNITGTTNSTSSTTGSLKISGGVGISKSLFVGNASNVVNHYFDINTGSGAGLYIRTNPADNNWGWKFGNTGLVCAGSRLAFNAIGLDANPDTAINRASSGTISISNAGSQYGDLVLRSLSATGSLSLPYKEISTNYTILSTDYTIVATAPATIQLPTCTGITGRILNIKNIGVGSVTVSAFPGELIDIDTSVIITKPTNITLQSRLSGGFIIL